MLMAVYLTLSPVALRTHTTTESAPKRASRLDPAVESVGGALLRLRRPAWLWGVWQVATAGHHQRPGRLSPMCL